MFFSKKTLLLISFCFCTITNAVYAQVTLTITTGPSWKDALLLKSLKASETYKDNTNYNVYPRLASTVWTHSGQAITYRTLLRFELSLIPLGSTVQSAVLYFKSDPAYTSGELSNHSLSGANSFFLQKVIQPWDPATVTWNTQPATTTTGRVLVAPSSSSTENIQVDITAMVQAMVNDPAANYGLMMKLENEVYYRSRNYASTDHANAALHPRLEVTYVPLAYWAISDGNWSDPIWSEDKNATTGGLLPNESSVNIEGHTVTVTENTTVKNLHIESANNQPGVLIIDSAELISNGEVQVDSNYVGNRIEIVNDAKLTVQPAQQ